MCELLLVCVVGRGWMQGWGREKEWSEQIKAFWYFQLQIHKFGSAPYELLVYQHLYIQPSKRRNEGSDRLSALQERIYTTTEGQQWPAVSPANFSIHTPFQLMVAVTADLAAQPSSSSPGKRARATSYAYSLYGHNFWAAGRCLHRGPADPLWHATRKVWITLYSGSLTLAIP